MTSIGYDRLKTRDQKRARRHLRLDEWKDVVVRTLKETNAHLVILVAAGVTYILLLALFPALTAFVSIYGLFVSPESLVKQLDVLANVVPAGGLDVIRDQLTRVTARGGPTLGLTLIISLGIALWSASSGVRSLFDVMNIAYDEKETRNFFVLTGISLLFTLLGIIGAAMMLAIVVALPAVLSVIGFGQGLGWLVQPGGYVLIAVMLLVGIAVPPLWPEPAARQIAGGGWPAGKGFSLTTVQSTCSTGPRLGGLALVD